MDSPSDAERRSATGQLNYLMLMTLSLTAFILGQNATYTCNYAKREISFYPDFDIETVCSEANLTMIGEGVCESFLESHGVGFYGWMATVPVDTQVCVSYNQPVPNVGWVVPKFDKTFNAAEVFSFMASIFGAFGWFSVIFATCCPVSQERIAGLSCYFSLACICQCLTFLIYGSNVCEAGFFAAYFPSIDMENTVEDVTCSLGVGAKLSITAAVLYAVCCSLAPFSTAPAPIGYQRAGDNRMPTSNTEQDAY